MFFTYAMYLATLFVAYLVADFAVKYTKAWSRRQVRFLTPFPVVGNTLQMGLLSGKSYGQGLRYLREYIFHNSDVFQFFLGSKHSYVISRPDWARQVFENHRAFDQSEDTMNMFGLVFPQGLIAVDGEQHKQLFRVLQPVLRTESIARNATAILHCADLLVQRWKMNNNNNGTIINVPGDTDTHPVHTTIVRDTLDAMLDSLGFIAFGQDFGNLDNRAKVANTAVTPTSNTNTLGDSFRAFVGYVKFSLLTPVPRRWMHLFLRYSPGFQLVETRLRDKINAMIDREVARQRETMNNACDSSTFNSKTSKTPNILSQLVQALDEVSSATAAAGGPHENKDDDKIISLTREQIVQNLKMFLLGGFETTASALAWFCAFAANNPDCQRCLKQELRDAHLYGTRDYFMEALTSQNSVQLPYLDAVVKETLRLAPMVASVTRTALTKSEFRDSSSNKRGDDTTKDTTGKVVFTVEPGDQVQVLFYQMHRDPRYWKLDPDQFLPHRFYDFTAGEAGPDADHDAFAYRPFGGGHRQCIGQHLARYELKLMIARLMQCVTFSSSSPSGVQFDLEQQDQAVVVSPKQLVLNISFDK
jgi:cytochrome P450